MASYGIADVLNLTGRKSKRSQGLSSKARAFSSMVGKLAMDVVQETRRLANQTDTLNASLAEARPAALDYRQGPGIRRNLESVADPVSKIVFQAVLDECAQRQ